MRTITIICFVCCILTINSKAQNIFETVAATADNPFNAALTGDLNVGLLGNTTDKVQVGICNYIGSWLYGENWDVERNIQHLSGVNAAFKLTAKKLHKNYFGIGVSHYELYVPYNGDKLYQTNVSFTYHHRIGQKGWQISEGLELFMGKENHQFIDGGCFGRTDYSHYNQFLHTWFPQAGLCFSKAYTRSYLYIGAYCSMPLKNFYTGPKFIPVAQIYTIYKTKLNKHITISPQVNIVDNEYSDFESISGNCKIQEAYSFNLSKSGATFSVFAGQQLNSLTGIHEQYINQGYEVGVAYGGVQLSISKAYAINSYFGNGHANGVNLKWNIKGNESFKHCRRPIPYSLHFI